MVRRCCGRWSPWRGGRDFEELGTRLRHARKVRKLRLKDVARFVNCSESLLSKIECNKLAPSLHMLHRIAAVLNLLPLEFVQDWGWRIPFLLGVVVGGVGFLLRRRLSIDPPPARSGFPLAEAVHHHWTAIVQGVAISLINAIPFYISFVYILPWLRKYADLSARNAGIINSANMLIIVMVIPAAAWLSDRVGRKPVLVAAATGLTLLAWPLFAVMEIGEIWAVFVGQFGIALLIGIYAAVSPIALSELFPRGVRCSAVSITHNLSAGLAGGTAPMVAEWLISRTGYSLAPAVYVTLAAALSLVAALSLRSGYSALAAEAVSIEPAIARA